jgi:hypothetical protein
MDEKFWNAANILWKGQIVLIYTIKAQTGARTWGYFILNLGNRLRILLTLPHWLLNHRVKRLQYTNISSLVWPHLVWTLWTRESPVARAGIRAPVCPVRSYVQ